MLACGLVLAFWVSQTVAQVPSPQSVEDGRRLTADGWRSLTAHRFAEARADFQEALARVPNDPFAELGLGEALFWLGRYQEALSRYEQVVARWPGVAHAYNGIGHACLNLAPDASHPRSRAALLDRADRAFAQALALEPGHPGARDGARAVAKMRRLAGRSLRLLESAVCLLLLLLATATALRVRTCLREGQVPSGRDLAWPLSLFVVTRGLLFCSFAAAPRLLAEAPTHPLSVLHDPGSVVLDVVGGRWDSNLYALIALKGYWREVPSSGAYSGVGQFPLLPVLLRWVGYAFDDVHLAALIVPNVALLAASVLLFGWVRRQHDRRLAIAATVALLVHPGSLYGSVLYAEPLVLLGMLGAVSHAQRGAFISAGLWGVFAGLARINALALIPWLLLEWWRQRRGRARSCALAAFSPLLSLAIFGLYLRSQFGDWFAYFHEMRSKRLGAGGFSSAPIEAKDLLWHLGGGLFGPMPARLGGPVPLLLLSILCIAVYAASAVALLRRRAFGPACFMLAGLTLALISSLSAQPRYLWPLFPALVCFGTQLDRKHWRYLLPLLSLALLLIAGAAYSRWYFVT